jgi:NitT/TauT family transport system permease protein
LTVFEPLKPVAPGAKIALGAAFFVLFLGAWALVTFGGVIDGMFLKDPVYTLRTGVNLFVEFGFAHDVGITIFRVVGGFVLAALVGVPLGILMGRSSRSRRSSSRSSRSRGTCRHRRSSRC